MPPLTNLARIRGALLGGAVGDALGAGIEFLSLSEIREAYGPLGLMDYTPAYGRRGGRLLNAEHVPPLALTEAGEPDGPRA